MTSKVKKQYEKLLNNARDKIAQRGEAEKTIIQVGAATCENAAGAKLVMTEFRKHVEASGRTDIVLRQTGCTGRCSREPIVNVIFPAGKPVKYQHVDTDKVHQIFTSHIMKGKPLGELMLDETDAENSAAYELFVCESAQCKKGIAAYKRLSKALEREKVSESAARIHGVNCFGLCRTGEDDAKATYMLVRPGKIIYRIESDDDIQRIIREHIKQGKEVEDLKISDEPVGQRFLELYGDAAFFSRQSRIALRNSGIINPEDIYEYISYDGFRALADILERGDAEWVINEISESKLRGRGGGGFPTGLKWKNAAREKASEKFVICNADEGDPGAFMDRSMLEGDPFSVVEGMIIGAYAIGATQGFFYIRAEYPLAINRIRNALAEVRKHNLLGDNILGSDFSFDLEIRLGAGAFVCGEETALIHSIEGARGQPRIRPPYPAEKGLWGMPTVINNVETWANVPMVIDYGANWFRQIGSDSSGGTKVFALAGKVEHTGLVEVPMGSTLREIVFDIGGGVADGKKIKAIQTGGPAGGCIPADWLDTAVDFDTLTGAGSIMGSGGMIVMDEDDCMVDIAKFFITFSQAESCGKCTPCREGTKRMLEILERITGGTARPDDIENLQRLAKLVQKSSLCGLGRAAPNPVLSTLRHFREEYEAHVYEHHCPARHCTALVKYEIDPGKCVGCTACARKCPVNCIDGEPKKVHVIDQARCIKCGRCYEVCKFDAVLRQ